MWVSDLRAYFETEDGVVKAVDGISFEIKRGDTLGVVGESGSGKSVASLSLMRLVPEPPGKIVSGSVVFHGRDVLKLSPREIRELRDLMGDRRTKYRLSDAQGKPKPAQAQPAVAENKPQANG